jgi:hypothetical protein
MSKSSRLRAKRTWRNKMNKQRRHRAAVRRMTDRLLGVEPPIFLHSVDGTLHRFSGEPGTVIKWNPLPKS